MLFQDGVRTPRAPPQSQGLSKIPSFLSFTKTLMSLFHGSLYIGASEHVSKDISSHFSVMSYIKAKEKRYSRKPE
jgi:hypothetical protein